MKWIAGIFVFVIALVFGTFAASLFWDNSHREVIAVDVPPPMTRIASVKTPIRAESLLGKWNGIWGHYSGDCTIEFDRVEGNAFYGTLRKGGAVVLFEGTFDPNTRMLHFNETKVVRLGAYEEWSLGKNSGVISPDGRTLVGSGRDKWGWYGWTAQSSQ